MSRASRLRWKAARRFGERSTENAPRPQPVQENGTPVLDAAHRPPTGVVLRRMIDRRPYRRYLLREVFD